MTMAKKTQRHTAGDLLDFDAMTPSEKERLYEQVQRIEPSDGKPLTASQRALHRRIKRKAGRPKVGKGAERLNVTIERSLLKAADQFAKSRGLSRSQMIAAGLRHLMQSA
jgi:hypothetical protein